MPAFDVVSEVDMHEAANAVNQANKELASRYDFRGTDARFEITAEVISLLASEPCQLGQMFDILVSKCSKRGIDVAALDAGNIEGSGKQVRRRITLRQGIDRDTTKQIMQLVKADKLNVQASIQGEKMRITGKKRNDLQAIMTRIKEATLEIPVQFNNLRD